MLCCMYTPKNFRSYNYILISIWVDLLFLTYRPMVAGW